MSHLRLEWPALLGAAAALALAAAAAVYAWRRRPRDPEEIERRRRAHLNQIGRIVEGQILEIVDLPPAEAPSRGGFPFLRKRRASSNGVAQKGRKVVSYSYSISGVTYETAQDITGLEERACLDRVVTGQPASVKYDPAHPGNSILVAESWSGLD